MTKSNKRGRVFDRIYSLVLFLSVCLWFLKGWRPLKIKWEEPYRTRFRWGLARKRRKIKAAIMERKRQNAPGQPERAERAIG